MGLCPAVPPIPDAMKTCSLLLSLVWILPACQSAPKAELAAADVAAIRALDATFCKLVVDGDWAQLAKTYYTADAVVMAPNAPVANGHAELITLLKAFPDVTHMELASTDIVGVGDLAYARGAWSMTFQTPAGELKDQGKCLAILRRQADGSWKAERDIWNSDLPAK